jgi:hypothetical protein
MHPFVELAKNAVETYIKEGRVIAPPIPLPPEMAEKAGVFVSIKKHGELRGCIGTFLPTKDSIAEEIIANAISSATKDPRFPPIDRRELADLQYSVDVLSTPQKVKGKSELDPKKYGVFVSSGFRRGLLLPDLEGVNTVDDQLRIAMLKAGISPDEDIEIFKFTVKRYK